MSVRPLITLLVLACSILLLAGCGGSDEGDSGGGAKDADGGGGSATAKLVHVDGTVKLDGDTLTVTPKDGTDPHSFSLGPEVERGALMALASSGAPARVTYREGEDVAAAVAAAPKAGEGVDSYEGLIVSVDAKQLVIDGDAGERTFDISTADAGAFDTEHLADHQSAGEPIRVYFRADAPDAGVAYEDA